MGAAFSAVVTALVKDLFTPFIAAIVGEPDFSAIEFTINGGPCRLRQVRTRLSAGGGSQVRTRL